MSNRFVFWPPSVSSPAHWGPALAALLALGCSDDSHRLGGGQEASRVSVQRVGTCANGADLEFIDQMEDDDGTIDMTAMRGGVWFSFNDKTPAGTQIPAADAEVFAISELVPPRAGSHFAARSQGGGFTKWGAGIGFELYNQKAYDLSRYAGITFWARRAPDTVSLRFAVTDSATAPRGGQCQGEYCSDYFGSDLSLDTAFRRYSFNWRDLTQQGWGEPHPDAVNASQIYGVRFQTDKNEDFDFWIDDIALLCHPD
jgi:hypothetical protein